MRQKIGIVGCGSVGEALLRLLAPFDVRTLALTRSGRTVAGADESLGPDGLDRLLRESDFVVVTFEQAYRSDGLKNTMKKRQYWIREEGAWKIVYEGAG